MGLGCLGSFPGRGQDFYGEWSQPWPLKPPDQNLPSEGIHSILLHTGKVLCVDSYSEAGDPNWADIVLVDPARAGESDAVQTVLDDWPDWPHQMFCSGHAHTVNGLVCFSGGGLPCNEQGHGGTVQWRTTFYRPDAGIGTLIAGPDEIWPRCGTQDSQTTKRWYPTVTAWSNKILITDGELGCLDHGEPNVPVVLQPNFQDLSASTWQPLCGAKYGSSWDLGWYPFLFVLVDGHLAMCGGNWADQALANRTTRKLNVVTGQWVSHFTPVSAMTGISACMYAPDKVLKVGFLHRSATSFCQGDYDEPNTIAQRIDFSQGPAAGWVTIDPMPRRRNHFYLLPMPDGTVMAIGGPGQILPGQDWSDVTTTEPDAWDPYTSQWHRYSTGQTRQHGRSRGYHNSAVLTPSGAVLVTGSVFEYVDGQCDMNRKVKSYQLFCPRYFFGTIRPLITSAPDKIYYNQPFTVHYSEQQTITRVRLIRLGAATHSFDMGTRSMELEFSADPEQFRLTVAGPPSENHAPPGYYMLFIASGPNGDTPSTARIVHLNGLTCAI